MTTIDHRILVPAAPDVVWAYVSDISHNPDWQVDCRDVSFLTSRREGPGMRWRYSTPRGRDCVIAVTAWYNGLGYEYYFVDGTPYRENKGRLRLQEIPEGTIVQWTFTYELGGVLGGVRNTLGVSRQVDHTIADSLRTLWQKIKELGAAAVPLEPKSLMREAPDVGARSAYQPRHPSAPAEPKDTKPTKDAPYAPPERAPAPRLRAEPPISDDDAQRIRVIAEPPIAEEDTKPRRAVTPPTEPAEIVPPEPEPDFLENVVDFSRFEPPRDPADTQPRVVSEPQKQPEPVEAPPEHVETASTQPPQAVETPTLSAQPTEASTPVPLIGEETEPLGFPLPESLPNYPTPINVQEQPTAPAPKLEEETQLDVKTEGDEQETQPPAPVVNAEPEQVVIADSKPEPEAPKVEIARPEPEAPSFEPKIAAPTASIWEIFGVQRPSETQETAAASAAPEAEAKSAPAIETASRLATEPVLAEEPGVEAEPLPEKIKLLPASTHIGLRVALRRKQAHVRFKA